MLAVPPLVCRFARIDSRVLAGAAVFLAWAFLSLTWSRDPLAGGHDIVRLIAMGSVALWAWSDEGEGIVHGMAWGTAASGMLAILQFWGWSPVEQAVPPAGLFYNRAVLGETSAVLLVWAVLTRRWHLAVPLAVPLALCESRVAVASAVLGIIAARPRFLWLAVPAAAGIFGLFLLGGKTASAAVRWEIWQTTVAEFTLWGNGLGSFQALHPFWDLAHSDLLQAGHELGILAIIPFVGFLVVLRRGVGSPVWAAAVALAAQSAVSFPFHLPTTACLGAAMAGHLCRHGHRACGCDDVVSGGALPGYRRDAAYRL